MSGWTGLEGSAQHELQHARSSQRVGVLAKAAGAVNEGVLRARVCGIKPSRVRDVVSLRAEGQTGSFRQLPTLADRSINSEVARTTNEVAVACLSGIGETPVLRNEIALSEG